MWIKGCVNVGGNITGNSINVGSGPTIDWLMGKEVEQIFGQRVIQVSFFLFIYSVII